MPLLPDGKPLEEIKKEARRLAGRDAADRLFLQAPHVVVKSWHRTVKPAISGAQSLDIRQFACPEGVTVIVNHSPTTALLRSNVLDLTQERKDNAAAIDQTDYQRLFTNAILGAVKLAVEDVNRLVHELAINSAGHTKHVAIEGSTEMMDSIPRFMLDEYLLARDPEGVACGYDVHEVLGVSLRHDIVKREVTHVPGKSSISINDASPSTLSES